MHPGWDLNPGPNGLQSSQRHTIHRPTSSVPILFIYHTIRLPSTKADYTISPVWHIVNPIQKNVSLDQINFAKSKIGFTEVDLLCIINWRGCGIRDSVSQVHFGERCLKERLKEMADFLDLFSDNGCPSWLGGISRRWRVWMALLMIL